MGISLRPSDAIQDLESAQIEIQLLQREIKQLRRELHFIYGWPWKFAFSTLPFGRSRAEMKLNHEYWGRQSTLSQLWRVLACAKHMETMELDEMNIHSILDRPVRYQVVNVQHSQNPNTNDPFHQPTDRERADRATAELRMVLQAIVPLLDPAGSQDVSSATNGLNRLIEVRRRLDGQESLQIARLDKEARCAKFDLGQAEAKLHSISVENDKLLKRLHSIFQHPWRFAFSTLLFGTNYSEKKFNQ